MKIISVLESGKVERFHTVPGVAKQSIAEHQWGVALIAQTLYPDFSKNLLLKALTHDCAEVFTGHIPFTTKKANPFLRTLVGVMETEYERELGIEYKLRNGEEDVLKLADMLEGFIYCYNRATEHGEKKAMVVAERWLEAIRMYEFKEEELIFQGVVRGRVHEILLTVKKHKPEENMK